jgi:hypothetical protein
MSRKTSKKTLRRDQVLTALELAFVACFKGDWVAAAREAGFPEHGIYKAVQRLKKRERIQEAIAQKQDAALSEIDAAAARMARALLKHNITPERVAERLDKVLKSGRHARRGWSDHMAALKLSCQLMGFLSTGLKKDDGEGLESGVTADGAYFFYRPKWRRKQDGLGSPVIDAPPALTS